MPVKRSGLVALTLAMVLLLAGCPAPSGVDPTEEPTDGASVVADVPKALAPFYKQDVEWTSCGQGAECASVEVPLDYADPGGDRITLAMKRLPSSGSSPIGSLLLNPGGPGGSGIGFLDDAVLASPDPVISREVLAAYDLVGFDPRGVGESTPVQCISDAELDELRAKVYDSETEAGLQAWRDDAAEFAQACGERSGRLLGFVDTVSAARDMDVLRAVLGDEALHYLGYSYGTLLGATYADLFPERVGRLVLDGALDPSLGYAELGYGQAAGFEAALRAYVADCLAGRGCPLRGSVDEAVAQFQTFLGLLAGSPLPTASGRELTQSLALSGFLVTLYDDRYWSIGTQALSQAINDGDGSTLLFLADIVADRNERGRYETNSFVAFHAVNCLDAPVDASQAAMDAAADRLEELSPTFGEFFAYGEVLCDAWPAPATGDPRELRAAGSDPILVIGTTGDPATPHEWSIALAGQLESARLITFEGEGHTAYGRSNDCVEDAVDDYLIDGVLPADGLTC